MTTAEQKAIAATAEAAARAAAAGGGGPSLARIYDALGAVPDPEIPVVSIVELGIVRGVRWDGATLVVETTPTYSGCPATDLIASGIVDGVRAQGVEDVRVETRLSPPWSTDWIAPEAKARLRAFGIAPPGAAASGKIDVRGISPLRRPTSEIRCPRCGATTTTLIAQFGSTACKALYRCDACREPFDYFKPI